VRSQPVVGTSSASREHWRQRGTRVSGSSTPVACDLADLDSVIAATNAVHTLGRLLDTLVASAGIMG
jgi:WW domain-containing oxidoreductase